MVNKLSKRALKKELKLAGANPSETDGLVNVANQLRDLESGSMSHMQASLSHIKPLWRRWHVAPIGAGAVAGVFIGAILIAYSQTSLPGSWLYPAKQVSEKVAVAIDPSYRATMMMRRSQEVKSLIKNNANAGLVLATLADYKTEANNYKTADYSAYEYCKDNLTQAASDAPVVERTAITETLSAMRS